MTNEWNGAPHLLCVQLGAPADVLACTPALRALRAQCPERRLTLLAAPAGAALAPCLPDVDAALAYAAPWTEGGIAATPGTHLDWISRLAAERFDGAVIFTRPGRSALPAALLCRLAGILLRAGWCRDDPSGLLTHWIADPEPGALRRHAVQRQLDLVRHLGAETADERLAFVPSNADAAAMRKRLQAAGIDPARRWLALHPGAGAQARRYAPQQWSELIAALHARIGCPFVLTGSARDLAALDAIATPLGAQVHVLAGEVGIGELGALLAQASLVVSSNAESTQLAAAVGTPVVSLLADPEYAPWQVPGRVPGHGIDGLDTLESTRVCDCVCSLLKQTETERIREAELE
ncbi:hypothetical protein ASF77_00930 [Massilia sp. Leaf139]|nr:hypothetical protein ASF77_00930 [Massilia sp. Leaf139]